MQPATIANNISRIDTIKLATRYILEKHLANYKLSGKRSPPEVLTKEILDECNVRIELANINAPTGKKWRLLDKLLPTQIADIMLMLYHILNIDLTDNENDDAAYSILALYQNNEKNEGIYVTSEKFFRKLARLYNYSLTNNEFKEIMGTLATEAKTVSPNREENLIAVNNGIFNYDTKQLLDFSPDYVFLSKSRVNYNPNAKNITIHNPDDGTDWDAESWMNELSDDPEVVNLLWEILGAIIRPNVHWDKFAWFYSESGNNGKGTLCELMRQLCGSSNYTSLSLADMGKDFALESLIHASAIITDENDVGTYIDKAANLKEIVTGDPININRKFKQAVTLKFRGFMVQCLNEMPRIRDKTSSLSRRQLVIPFLKCFTGKEPDRK